MVRLGSSSSATSMFKMRFKGQEKASGGSFPVSPLQSKPTHRISELKALSFYRSQQPSWSLLWLLFLFCSRIFCGVLDHVQPSTCPAVSQGPGLTNNSVWSRNSNRSWRKHRNSSGMPCYRAGYQMPTSPACKAEWNNLRGHFSNSKEKDNNKELWCPEKFSDSLLHASVL